MQDMYKKFVKDFPVVTIEDPYDQVRLHFASAFVWLAQQLLCCRHKSKGASLCLCATLLGLQPWHSSTDCLVEQRRSAA